MARHPLGPLGGTGINISANPCAVYNSLRTALPTDTNSGGGVIRNLPGWDLQMIRFHS
jgi:hypothetical protein